MKIHISNLARMNLINMFETISYIISYIILMLGHAKCHLFIMFTNIEFEKFFKMQNIP